MSEIKVDWSLAPECTAYADVTFFDKNHCEVGNQLDIKCPKTKTAADEGEKWTHTYYNNLCLIVAGEPDRHGYIAIKTDKAGYQAVDKDAVKPIKPKLTKAQAWDLIQDYEGLDGLVRYILRLHEQYDII